MDSDNARIGIEAREVTVRYGEVLAVNGVDLTVAPGEVVGIIGPNGAGKTSLLECIEGLRSPDEGVIRVGGLDPVADRAQMTRLAGVQLQHATYPPRVRVNELCQLFASLYPQPADYRQLLEEFGMAEHARRPVTKLSGGQQQRLSLVLALLGRPRVVFLDELSTGLDPAARRGVWEGLRSRNDAGLTTIITSHHMDEVEYLCDRVVVLVKGEKVADDTVTKLIQAHAADVSRVVVEDTGDNPDLRRALEQIGDGVRVMPAGNRLHIDVAGPQGQAAVAALLNQRGLVSRQRGASLDDAYMSLTGEQVTPTGLGAADAH